MVKWEYKNKPCYLENSVVREPCKRRTACIRLNLINQFNHIKSDWIWLLRILKMELGCWCHNLKIDLKIGFDWVASSLLHYKFTQVIFTTNQVNTAYWDNFNLALHCVVWSLTEMALNLNWKITLSEIYQKYLA